MRFLRRLYRRVFPTPEYELRKSLQGCSTLLDVGCGVKSKVPLLAPQSKVYGVDVHPQAVLAASKRGVYEDVKIRDVAKKGLKGLARVDGVVAFDLIEHLEKSEGHHLLDEMERAATRRVVVFTPVGFIPQDEEGGNPYQVHRSGWSPDEFIRRGYRVIGIHGWAPLRGDHASVRFKPVWFWTVISDLTQLFTKRRPSAAFHMLCIKEIGSGG